MFQGTVHNFENSVKLTVRLVGHIRSTDSKLNCINPIIKSVIIFTNYGTLYLSSMVLISYQTETAFHTQYLKETKSATIKIFRKFLFSF